MLNKILTLRKPYCLELQLDSPKKKLHGSLVANMGHQEISSPKSIWMKITGKNLPSDIMRCTIKGKSFFNAQYVDKVWPKALKSKAETINWSKSGQENTSITITRMADEPLISVGMGLLNNKMNNDLPERKSVGYRCPRNCDWHPGTPCLVVYTLSLASLITK
jgi:hypothetical protein